MAWQEDVDLHNKLSLLVKEGYKHSEILDVVKAEFQYYDWSSRTLRRRLQHFELRTNDPLVSIKDVINCVKEELMGPGKLLGFRAMHKKLRIHYGLLVKQQQVLDVMRLLDASGMEDRKLINKRKKFHKRIFTSKGPNWVWSIDGHDKLMGWHKFEYPLAIHGCVDTFSRKIIWLRAWPSNSSPKLPARFYFQAVQENNVVPTFVRSDRGNENSTLFSLHNFMRGTPDGSSFLYGSSVANQVIERWWRDLRERNGNYFRETLHELSSTGLYDSGNETCRVLLSVLLIPLLQVELDIFKRCWNAHRIRKQNIRRPCGIPNFLYNFPEVNGSQQAGQEVDEERMSFSDRKLNLNSEIDFVPTEVHECCKNLLVQELLYPVTFSNFIQSYTYLFKGCKEKGIVLNFKSV